MLEKSNVSVVIPYYHASKTIERSLESIRQQTLQSKEVILINDNGNDSEDNYLESLIATFSDINLIILKNKVNKGAAYSRNLGWGHAKSKYIAFLDSDDSWDRLKLEVQYNFMESKKAIISGHKLNISRGTKGGLPERMSFLKMLLLNRFPTPTVMVKRNIEERFDSNKRYVDDHLLWLLIIEKYKGRAWLINRKLAFVYKSMFGESGLSSHLLKMELSELDNYYKLYRLNKIKTYTLLILVVLSLIKFIRRCIITVVVNLNPISFYQKVKYKKK